MFSSLKLDYVHLEMDKIVNFTWTGMSSSLWWQMFAHISLVIVISVIRYVLYKKLPIDVIYKQIHEIKFFF